MDQQETIDEKYKVAYKLLLEIRDQLEHLESGQDVSVFIQGKISTNINNLSRYGDQLEVMAAQQPASRREIWRIRIKQLMDECKSLRASVGTFFEQKTKQSKQEELRAQLFERKTKGNVGPSGKMEQLVNENESLGRSKAMIEDIEQIGVSVRDSIFTQNDQILNIQNRVREIVGTLGVSNSLIKVIQRRQLGDKIIVYSGMVLTLLIIALLWYYVR